MEHRTGYIIASYKFEWYLALLFLLSKHAGGFAFAGPFQLYNGVAGQQAAVQVAKVYSVFLAVFSFYIFVFIAYSPSEPLPLFWCFLPKGI
jgi:hypothetical protein